jgi:hypothetical protein
MTPCRRETRKIPMTATDVKRGRNITRQLACSSTTFTRSTSIRCDWNSDSRSVLGLAAALLQFVDDPINSTISSDAPLWLLRQPTLRLRAMREYYVRPRRTVQPPVWSLRRATLRSQAMRERPTGRQCAATLLYSLQSPNDATPRHDASLSRRTSAYALSQLQEVLIPTRICKQ